MMTRSQAQRSGVALVLVLAFLVLISVFVIGFFVSASNELAASSSYAATISTQQLSETATNIVMGQIREATTRPGEVWASQPGCVRTFRTTAPEAFYKLYSAQKMVVEGTGGGSGETAAKDYRPVDTDVPIGGTGGWNHKPALFVDLNDAVRVPILGSDLGVSGTLGKDYEYRYPIFDPNAFFLRESEAAAGVFPAPGATTTTVDKRVEGAELIRYAGDDSDKNPNGVEKKTVYSRMPVRWLYVLKDGTVTSPDSDSDGTIAHWTDARSPNSPTLTNPIVGRIAFWTDDDASKVNINTAGGYSTLRISALSKTEDQFPGSYWDSPRFQTAFDRGVVNSVTGDVAPSQMSLALAQPIRNEFQRYPGHPSTTSLGLVFRNLLTSQQIYQVTPRLNGGGSEGGSKRLIQAKGAAALSLKRDRLYSSVDEMLFAQPRPSDLPDTARRLTSAEYTLPAFTPELVDRMRFFLTAHSRAPELNMFGRPRVSIWPLWPIYGAAGGYNTALTFSALGGSSKTSRNDFRTLVNANPTEKLLAFCGTLGPKENDTYVRPYFFQRSNPYSATEDATIPRNVALFKYLTGMLALPMPGSPGSSPNTPSMFKEKYPGEPDPTAGDKVNGDYRQILSEIFDYVRCVNLVDTSHDTPASGTQTKTPDDTGYDFGKAEAKYKYSPHGIVVPSVTPGLNNAPGFGRFPTISEAALVFHHAGYMVERKNASKQWETRFVLNTDGWTGASIVPGGGILNGGRKAYREIYCNPDGTPKTNEPNPNDPTTANMPDAVQFDVLGQFVRAFLMFEQFTPMEGYAGMTSFAESDTGSDEVRTRGLFFEHEVTGLENFGIATEHMVVQNKKNLYFLPTDKSKIVKNRFWDTPIGRGLGGSEGFLHTMFHCIAEGAPNGTTSAQAINSRYYYPFQSTGKFDWPETTASGQSATTLASFKDSQGRKVTVQPAFGVSGFPGVFIPRKPGGRLDPRPIDKYMKFYGGKAQLKISFAGTLINTLELNFPDSGLESDPWDKHWPVPTDNIWQVDNGGYIREGNMSGSDGANPVANPTTSVRAEDQFSLARRVQWSRQPSDEPSLADNKNYGSRYHQLILPGDTIRSLVPFNPNSSIDFVNSKPMGDPRALALIGNTNSQKGKYLQPHPYYLTQRRHAQCLKGSDGTPYIQGLARDPDEFNVKVVGTNLGQDVSADTRIFETHFGTMFGGLKYQSGTVNVDVPHNVEKIFRSDGLPPDFDNGLANSPDGGFLNKSDEGSGTWRVWWTRTTPHKWIYTLPYYDTSYNNTEQGYDTYFSPNKQMPSPVQFGSLLAGRTKHWQTLAFCPNTAGPVHPGITRDPKDHYFLDFFTMPVVEPYAISEPLSTAGKVNLNFGMVPFGHIRRSTAMRAVLHPVRIPAVPSSRSMFYKIVTTDPPPSDGRTYRFRVNRDETLKGFMSYFNGNTTGRQEMFRTGSQICEMFLYPNMYTTEGGDLSGAKTPKPELADIGSDPKFAPGDAGMKDWWSKCLLTGDNLREKPYNDIYPRITTKSNTFTVHMWVQALKKSSTVGLSKSDAEVAIRSWDEKKDAVAAEYRGSSTIERYIDPDDRHFDFNNTETKAKGDYLDPDQKSLEGLYRFRIIESKRFAP